MKAQRQSTRKMFSLSSFVNFNTFEEHGPGNSAGVRFLSHHCYCCHHVTLARTNRWKLIVRPARYPMFPTTADHGQGQGDFRQPCICVRSRQAQGALRGWPHCVPDREGRWKVVRWRELCPGHPDPQHGGKKYGISNIVHANLFSRGMF